MAVPGKSRWSMIFASRPLLVFLLLALNHTLF
jgi:hypothetical protein